MEELYGKITLNGNEYPFAYKDYVINLITAGEVLYIEDLNDRAECEYIEGYDNNGNKLIFIECEFVKNIFSISNWITTKGVIVLKQGRYDTADELFDRIIFYSKCLNEFYSPVSISKTDHKEWNGKFVVETLPFNESNKLFEIDDYTVTFGFYVQQHYNETVLLSSTPICSFSHNEAQSIEKIKNDYFKILHFLSFVSFSKSVDFDKIELYKKTNGFEIPIGRVYIKQEECNYVPKPNRMIQLREIPEDSFINLFKNVTNSDNIFKYYYVPDKPQDVNIVDHAKWITTAVCFEGLFNMFFSDFKSKANENFAEAKSAMLNATDECLKTLSGKKIKKYAEKCREQIVRYDGLLEEKAFLTDIYNNFVVTYLAEIKHDLDILVVNGMRDRSKECLSILNDYAYEFKKLVNSQWDIYYSMTETTKDYHILNNELKAIYAELEIEMEPDVYSALTYPNITSAINILNPLRENMFKGFIPTENNSYFKL